MTLETFLVPAATAVGLAAGFAAAAVAGYKQKKLPEALPKDAWEHLKELTQERAEAMAQKKALQRAYAAGSINEAAFVGKDAHYTKLVDNYDKEIDKAIQELGAAFLPEELRKGEKKLQELNDLAVLSNKIKELKHEKKRLEEEKSELYLQLTEIEEDKRMHIAEKDKLLQKYEADNKKLSEMTKNLEKLEAQRTELEKKLESMKPKEQKLSMLEKENRILRESLSRARKKLRENEKAVGVLEAIVEKNSHKIDESRKQDELRELINPENPGVKELARKYNSPQKAYDYVRDFIVEVHPKISASYWLAVDDVMRLSAGDDYDKAMLLCSIIRAIGKEAWVAVLEMRNGYKRAVVLHDNHVLDPCEAREYEDFHGLSDEEAISKYMFDGFPVKRVMYRFNDRIYKES